MNEETGLKGKITKVKTLVDKIKQLLNDIYLGEKTYDKITGKVINASKIFIVSTRKFLADSCPTKASSIAYTAIISLIPTLTVILTFYSIFSGVGDKKDEIFNTITKFMLEHNIKINIAPVIEAISNLIENAGKIGGVGAVIMIFSATALLRTLESSLNEIWSIEKARSIFMKVIYYWAALSLGPIIVISGTTLAAQFTNIFTSPNYKSAYVTGKEKVWVVGDKSKIQTSGKTDIKLKNMPIERIDFDNQRIFQYQASDKTFREYEFKIEENEFEKFQFNDIQFIKNTGWIVGREGILLTTSDSGSSWFLNKFGSFTFNDIHMIDSYRGFIASDNGNLFSTSDGGKNWEILEWKNMGSDLNKISFYKDQGIVCGDGGVILTTIDKGSKWELRYLNEAKIKKRFVNLNNSYFIDSSKIIIAGDEGNIILSSNGGKSWKRKKFLERNYYGIYFSNGKTGFISGDKGILISTNDGGETWQRSKQSRHTINQIIADNKSMWIIGDMGTVKKTSDKGATWQGVQGGNFVLYLLNFMTPFLSIWMLFLLIYIVLPNMKIPFKPAAIGAAFTSIVWVIFLLLFNIYVRSFAKGTLAIYGALAAIPIFLLLVYASSLIILYGAEVSYTLMHPHTYRKIKKSSKIKNEIYLFYGISILYKIYKKFETGKGATTVNELLKITSNKDDDVDHFVKIFKKEKLIIESGEDDLIPANSSKNIILSDIINLIHDVSLSIPGVGSSPDQLKKHMGNLFSRMKDSKNDIVKGITLADIIEKM